MDWTTIFEVLGAIGGVATIAGGVAAVVGKIVSSRFMQSHKAKLDAQLETHKSALIIEADLHRLQLKRQELMFEREYLAASEFFRFFNDVLPEPWMPDLDWSDVQIRIAENFLSHEKKIKNFLNQHSAALSEDVRKLILHAKMQANEGSFEVAQETEEGEYKPASYPSKTVCTHVDKFYEALNKAEQRLRVDLQKGSFAKGNSEVVDQGS